MQEISESDNLFVEFRCLATPSEQTKLVQLAPDVLFVRRRQGSVESRYIFTKLVSTNKDLPRPAEVDKLLGSFEPDGTIFRFRKWFQRHFKVPFKEV